MNTSDTVKTILAVIAILAAGWVTVEVLRFILWMCYYSGIPM